MFSSAQSIRYSIKFVTTRHIPGIAGDYSLESNNENLIWFGSIAVQLGFARKETCTPETVFIDEGKLRDELFCEFFHISRPMRRED